MEGYTRWTAAVITMDGGSKIAMDGGSKIAMDGSSSDGQQRYNGQQNSELIAMDDGMATVTMRR